MGKLYVVSSVFITVPGEKNGKKKKCILFYFLKKVKQNTPEINNRLLLALLLTGGTIIAHTWIDNVPDRNNILNRRNSSTIPGAASIICPASNNYQTTPCPNSLFRLYDLSVETGVSLRGFSYANVINKE